MNLWILLLGVLFVGFVGSNVYWRRRLRATEEGLEVASDWETGESGDDTDRRDAGSEELLALREASQAAGVPPAELPERIETYNRQLRDRESELESARDAWVDSWWEAATREPVPTDGPRIVTLGVDTGGRPVVRAFAIHAMETENEVVVALDRTDGTFAVGASESVAGVADASEIAEEIATYAGGGAGGSDQLATGGGADPDAIAEAIDAVARDVEDRLEEHLATPVRSIGSASTATQSSP